MPLNIDIQQILLHMLNFVILFAALYFLTYKPVKKFMANRSKYYEDLDAQADNAMEEAKQIKTEYESRIKDIDSEAQKIKSDAAREAEDNAKKILSEAESKAAEILDKARDSAEREKNQAIISANKEIRMLAEEAASKLIIEGEDAYESFLSSVNAGENN